MTKLKPGIYRHYKNKLYEVIGVATHSETHEQFVIYKNLYDTPDYPINSLWARTLKMFQETVEKNGKRVKRFNFIESLNPEVRVGIGVIVRKKGKVLLGKRKGSHGQGSWAFPGGHIEFGETIEECTLREIKEEVGITIKKVQFGSITNDIFKKEHKHYITIYMVCDYKSGKVVLKEPEKCEKWDWFEWNKLPKPLFLPTQTLRKQRFDPFSM